MFGVQNVSPAWPTLKKDRASFPMVAPIILKRVLLKEADVVMTCGKLVAHTVGAAKETAGEYATPCRASLHHWYAPIPRLGTAAAPLSISVIFSACANRETMYCARWSGVRDKSQAAEPTSGPVPSHGLSAAVTVKAMALQNVSMVSFPVLCFLFV
ncbi:hypothetical protein DIPPA_29305 [Diplonema papillatum]|nr:hypothetical protein DIPPA_29305 [Diplonema papillatum]